MFSSMTVLSVAKLHCTDNSVAPWGFQARVKFYKNSVTLSFPTDSHSVDAVKAGLFK